MKSTKSKKAAFDSDDEEDIPAPTAVGYASNIGLRQKNGSEYSIDIQKQLIEFWCKSNDYDLQDIRFDDIPISYTSSKRPNLQNLLDCMTEGYILIVMSVACLGSSGKDFTEVFNIIMAKKGRLIAIKERLDTDGKQNKPILQMLDTLSTMDTTNASKKIKEALKEKKQRGEFVGRPPYGWKLENGSGSNLVEVPEEQRIISRIRDLHDGRNDNKKFYTYSAIARTLNQEGVKPPGKCSSWNHNNVSRAYAKKDVVTAGKRKDDNANIK